MNQRIDLPNHRCIDGWCDVSCGVTSVVGFYTELKPPLCTQRGRVGPKGEQIGFFKFPDEEQMKNNGYMLYVEMLVDFFASPGR